jgi:hypothetical protein
MPFPRQAVRLGLVIHTAMPPGGMPGAPLGSGLSPTIAR